MQIQRNPRGTKSIDFNSWPNVLLDDMPSLLATHQYIQQSIITNKTDIQSIITLPSDTHSTTWVFEHTRQFCSQLNQLVSLLEECCTKETCYEMQANSITFICTLHSKPRSVSI